MVQITNELIIIFLIQKTSNTRSTPTEKYTKTILDFYTTVFWDVYINVGNPEKGVKSPCDVLFVRQ
jgi:hypothetical protein